MPESTRRRVTPTGELVLPADAPEADWLAERRRRICSSDLPAILGVSPYTNALEVWYDKRGELPPQEPTDPLIFGRLFEEPIAREWARRNRTSHRKIGLIQHIDNTWAGATLDRLVRSCPLNDDKHAATGRCFLEVKNRTAWVAGKWAAGVPDDVAAQVHWALMVSGLDHAHIVCLIDSADYRQFVLRRDAALEVDMWSAALAFRASLDWDEIDARIFHAPVDPEAAVDLDNRLHPDRSGYVDADPELLAEVAEAITEYAAASAEIAGPATRKERAKARLVELAGGKAGVKANGDLLFTYQPGPNGRRKVDLERLAERYPDAYKDTVTTGSSPSLLIKKPGYALVSREDAE